MSAAPDPDAARQQIANALTVLRSTRPEDPGAVRQTFELVVMALEAARAALDELESELDVATGPDRHPVEELIHAQQELEQALLRQAELEQQLALERAEREAVETVEQEERKRLGELEKKNAEFESLLLDDEAAFDRYFDQALDRDEKRGRKPPQR